MFDVRPVYLHISVLFVIKYEKMLSWTVNTQMVKTVWNLVNVLLKYIEIVDFVSVLSAGLQRI